MIYSVDDLEEIFYFNLKKYKKDIIFTAFFPKKDIGISRNLVFVGWEKEGIKKCTSYRVNDVLEMLNLGSWEIIE